MAEREIITPDGLTERWKEFVKQKLAGKYSEEQVAQIVKTIDFSSREALMNRSNKLTDAFKSAIPFAQSTSEKMSKEYRALFEKKVPEDITAMLTEIDVIAKKQY